MKKIFFILPFVALLGLSTSSCSSNVTPSCTSITTPATYNGDNSYTIMVAQMISTTSPIMFQVAIVDQNCEEYYTFNLATQGFDTYSIDGFDNAVSVIKSSLIGSSQVMYILESGMVSVIDKGNDTYELEVDGSDSNGQDFTFKTTHTF